MTHLDDDGDGNGDIQQPARGAITTISTEATVINGALQQRKRWTRWYPTTIFQSGIEDIDGKDSA